MDWIIWLIIIATLFIILYMLNLWLGKDNKMPYALQKCILTDRELEFYKILKPIADELQLVICPKVRLADIVKVHNAGKEYQKYFNKIQGKHIDFVLCDSEMKFKLLLELDDRSHQRKDRQANDIFKNELAKHVSLPLLRIKSLNDDLKSKISEALTCPVTEQENI